MCLLPQWTFKFKPSPCTLIICTQQLLEPRAAPGPPADIPGGPGPLLTASVPREQAAWIRGQRSGPCVMVGGWFLGSSLEGDLRLRPQTRPGLFLQRAEQPWVPRCPVCLPGLRPCSGIRSPPASPSHGPHRLSWEPRRSLAQVLCISL